MAKIVDQLRPDLFGLADHDGLGIPRHLFRAERGMKTAHDHRHTAPSKLAGDLVGPAGGIGLHADRHQIGRFIVGNDLHAIIMEADIDTGGC